MGPIAGGSVTGGSGYWRGLLPLENWAIKLFNICDIHPNFAFFHPEFEKFKMFVDWQESSYKPNPLFLKEVLRCIYNKALNLGELYSMEERICNSLEGWTVSIFNLSDLPANFTHSRYRALYEEFQCYILLKGKYQPNPVFLEKVLESIHDSTFEYNKLQPLERELFDESQFIQNQLAPSLRRTSDRMNEAKKFGMNVEGEVLNHPSSLLDISYKALRKNGYPQAFIYKEDVCNHS